MTESRFHSDHLLIAGVLLLLVWLPLPLGSNRDWSAAFLVLATSVLAGGLGAGCACARTQDRAPACARR